MVGKEIKKGKEQQVARAVMKTRLKGELLGVRLLNAVKRCKKTKFTFVLIALWSRNRVFNGQRPRQTSATESANQFIALTVTGYDLPKDVAFLLYQYTQEGFWLGRTAGKRVGAMVRGEITSHLGWSIEEVSNFDEASQLVGVLRGEAEEVGGYSVVVATKTGSS